MKTMYYKVLLSLSFYFFFLTNVPASVISTLNVAQDKPVKADSQEEAAFYAVDGDTESYWQSGASVGNHWLEIDLQEAFTIDRVVLPKIEGVDSLEVRLWSEGQWQLVFAGKPANPLIGFEPKKASRVQLKSVDGQQVRIYEVQVFQHDPQPVLVNQSGYDLHRHKRFTAPNAADGTPFTITHTNEGKILYEGAINKHIGDFTSFQPEHPGSYEIHLLTERESTSVPFNIGPNLIEKVSYQPAVDFMVDVRCWFGDARDYSPTDEDADCPTLGVAWRDGTQYSFELPSLINLYFSNPSAFTVEKMPLQASYLGVRHELPENTPEIVRLIHWAVDIYLRGKVDHTLLKGQLAYFLYAYPWLSDYIPESVYQEAKDYLFEIWDQKEITRWSWHDLKHTANLFQTYEVIGTGKGFFPPGHSIIPNLLMYEVAQREGMDKAEDFFQAAYNQTKWIIENLDWQDPRTTKGQRQNEYITMTGLAFFLENYPENAPKGLKEKIMQWSRIMIARSDNMWDFRKYSDNKWVIPTISESFYGEEQEDTGWGFNEPGNVAGFPAACLAAARVVKDSSIIEELKKLAVSHVDNIFGRNPTGRHFCFDAITDFEGVEMGWFQEYQGGYGNLQGARGVLDGSPKETTYPYDPYAGDPGHTEGWVNFNTAWNTALGYISSSETEIKIYDRNFSDEIEEITKGSTIGIELIASLNLDYDQRENAEAILYTGRKKIPVKLKETSKSSGIFRGKYTFADEFNTDELKIGYGFGWHEKHKIVSIK